VEFNSTIGTAGLITGPACPVARAGESRHEYAWVIAWLTNT
jgi:hypothetical protein